MVGRGTLDPLVVVRIHSPQPVKMISKSYTIAFLIFPPYLLGVEYVR